MLKKLIICAVVLVAGLFFTSWPSLYRDSAEVISSVSVPGKETYIVSEPSSSSALDISAIQKAQEGMSDSEIEDKGNGSLTNTGYSVPADPVIETQIPESSSIDDRNLPTNSMALVFPYSENVSRGAVRYVSQLRDTDTNGWGKYAWKAGMECMTACISMALSYLGINASPESILDYSSKTVLKSCYGIEDIFCSDLTQTSIPADQRYSVFKDMFDSFRSDPKLQLTPVLIYLSGNGNHHAILVIGCGEENTFAVLDPANEGIHHITVNESGEIRTEDGFLDRYTPSGDGFPVIESLAQWCMTDND